MSTRRASCASRIAALRRLRRVQIRAGMDRAATGGPLDPCGSSSPRPRGARPLRARLRTLRPTASAAPRPRRPGRDPRRRAADMVARRRTRAAGRSTAVPTPLRNAKLARERHRRRLEDVGPTLIVRASVRRSRPTPAGAACHASPAAGRRVRRLAGRRAATRRASSPRSAAPPRRAGAARRRGLATDTAATPSADVARARRRARSIALATRALAARPRDPSRLRASSRAAASLTLAPPALERPASATAELERSAQCRSPRSAAPAGGAATAAALVCAHGRRSTVRAPASSLAPLDPRGDRASCAARRARAAQRPAEADVRARPAARRRARAAWLPQARGACRTRAAMVCHGGGRDGAPASPAACRWRCCRSSPTSR